MLYDGEKDVQVAQFEPPPDAIASVSVEAMPGWHFTIAMRKVTPPIQTDVGTTAPMLSLINRVARLGMASIDGVNVGPSGPIRILKSSSGKQPNGTDNYTMMTAAETGVRPASIPATRPMRTATPLRTLQQCQPLSVKSTATLKEN